MIISAQPLNTDYNEIGLFFSYVCSMLYSTTMLYLIRMAVSSRSTKFTHHFQLSKLK